MKFFESFFSGDLYGLVKADITGDWSEVKLFCSEI
jgi:hypothetical protein